MPPTAAAKAKARSKPGVKRSVSKSKAKAEVVKAKLEPSLLSGASIVTVNRAPVLTLWMDVCLRRLGYADSVALTVAKVICGRCAAAKGKAINIFRPGEPDIEKLHKKPAAAEKEGSVAKIAGHVVFLTKVASGGLRASDGGDPAKVEAYLRSAFKDEYSTVRRAMEKAAASRNAGELQRTAFTLYEGFRPAWKGWGVKGELHLKDIQAVA